MKKIYLFFMVLFTTVLMFGQNRTADVIQTNNPTNDHPEMRSDVAGTTSTTPVMQSLSGKATCTYTGSLTAADNTNNKRLLRDGTPSTCAAPKTYPGDFAANIYYETFTIPNNTGAAQCVTITPSVPEEIYVHFTAYLGSFDPTNLGTNYLGDSGSSSAGGTNQGFEVTIPAGQTMVIVANTNFDGDVMTGEYTIEVTGLNCLTSNCVKDFTIPATNPTMPNRLFRDGTASVCGTPKAYPGNIAAIVNYATVNIKNNTGAEQCININGVITDPALGGGIHLSAYNNTFDPNNLGTNFAGDSGLSVTTTTGGFGVTVPNNGVIVLVMNTNYEGDVLTGPITITVDGVSCSGILASEEVGASAKNTIIYPNPTDSVLYVKGIEMKSVKVFDASGKMVPVNMNNNTIDTSKLAKGVYALQITDKGGNIILERFIKK